MLRDVFAKRFHDAASEARDFARTFVEEPLPEEMTFRAHLNSSYDRNPLQAGLTVYPNDDNLHRCNEEDAISLLWRDGKVPQWIDVSVVGETESSTVVRLLCCGRFTELDQLLYHQHEGRPPLHVVGPSFPVRHQKGQRFSIYDRSACWSLEDVDRIRNHAGKVWSLHLVGSDFDDRVLSTLPEFPRMDILELESSPVSGAGLGSLVRQPQLWVLRISLAPSANFHLVEIPKLTRLKSVAIENIPNAQWGFEQLIRSCPALEELTLDARTEIALEGRFPTNMKTLRITATNVADESHLPSRVDDLSLHLANASETDLARILQPVASVQKLGLRGTPVGDVFAKELAARWPLTFLDVVDTQVSEKAVRELNATYPTMRMYPNLRPSPKA
jgi:hypothetical protein